MVWLLTYTVMLFSRPDQYAVHEFPTQEACEAAAASIISNHMDNNVREGIRRTWKCTLKQD